MRDLSNLKEQYWSLLQTRMDELELEEDKKTLKGKDFMFLENKLCYEISQLKKELGLIDGMKPPVKQKCHACGKKFKIKELNLVGSFILCSECKTKISNLEINL